MGGIRAAPTTPNSHVHRPRPCVSQCRWRVATGVVGDVQGRDGPDDTACLEHSGTTRSAALAGRRLEQLVDSLTGAHSTRLRCLVEYKMRKLPGTNCGLCVVRTTIEGGLLDLPISRFFRT